MGAPTRIAVVLVGLLLPCVAAAEHGDPWLVALPDPSEPLPPNGRIVLFSENGPDWIVTKPEWFEYRLVGPEAGEQILLWAGGLRHGPDWDGYGTSRITLFPVRRLQPNHDYRLEVREREDDSPWEPVFVAAVFEGPTAIYGGPAGEARWRTAAAPDRDSPRFVLPPSVTADPADDSARNISVRIADESAVGFLVRAVSERGELRVRRTYHQAVFGTNEGCHWLDLSPPTSRFRLWLTAVDAAGHRTRAPYPVTAGPGETIRLCLDSPDH